MGQLSSRIATTSSGLQEKRFLMFGLDYSGKTSLLYKMLYFNENVTTVPTVGINGERVEYKNMGMTIWDISAGSKIRPLLCHYFAGAEALIYVIDSTDQERLEEAVDLMRNVLADPNTHHCHTVLIFLNKQDLPGAISPSLMIDKLELDSTKSDPLKRRKWHMQACCAKTGEGIFKGLEWLSDALTNEEARRPTTT